MPIIEDNLPTPIKTFRRWVGVNFPGKFWVVVERQEPQGRLDVTKDRPPLYHCEGCTSSPEFRLKFLQINSTCTLLFIPKFIFWIYFVIFSVTKMKEFWLILYKLTQTKKSVTNYLYIIFSNIRLFSPYRAVAPRELFPKPLFESCLDTTAQGHRYWSHIVLKKLSKFVKIYEKKEGYSTFRKKMCLRMQFFCCGRAATTLVHAALPHKNKSLRLCCTKTEEKLY